MIVKKQKKYLMVCSDRNNKIYMKNIKVQLGTTGSYETIAIEMPTPEKTMIVLRVEDLYDLLTRPTS